MWESYEVLEEQKSTKATEKMPSEKKPGDIDFKCAIALMPDFLPSSANWQTQKSSLPPSVKLSSEKLNVVGSVGLTPGKKHGLMLAFVNI